MSNKPKLTPVRKEGIADSVRMETLKVLAEEGEVFQSKLISAVANRLVLDPNTTSGLVRKFLDKQKGDLVKISKSAKTGFLEGPRRKYWELTTNGIGYLYGETHDLAELSKVITKLQPPEYGGMLAIYETIASSKKLCKEVELDLNMYYDGLAKSAEYHNIGKRLQRGLQIKVDVGITYDIGGILIASVMQHLAQDKDLRSEVGYVRISKVCEFAAALARDQEQNLKSFKSVIRVMRGSMESPSKVQNSRSLSSRTKVPQPSNASV